MTIDRLTFTEVSRHFERRRALVRVSFTCETGSITGLLGHNGAGKSTVLALAATLLRPSSGEVRFGELTTAESGAVVRAQVGLLAHETQLYPELTARENLTFFARLHGVSDVADRVTGALRQAGLDDRADDPVATFSRGMRQRLALERTLLHGPRLLLLDEPFSGLDATSTAALVARLTTLAGEGRIVLLATHDLDLAEQAITRAIVLAHGRVAARYEDSHALRERYARVLQERA